MTLNKEDLESIIAMIEKRKHDVLEANNITEDNDSPQYQWITGIYNDVTEYIQSQL